MPRRPLSFAALLCAASLFPLGCSKPADDASLTAAVQTRIAGDAALGATPIQSSVQAGVATLAGNVGSDAARALAANDAAQVPGIRTVVNNLVVQAPAPPPQTTAALPVVPVPEPLPIPTPRRPRDLPRRHTPPPPRANAVTQPSPSRASLPPEAEHAANTPPPPAPPPPPPVKAALTFRDITLPTGTILPVRITQTLDSGTTQQGQSFSGTLAVDVLADSVVAIPQGSTVSGRVDAVQEAAHFKGNSLLSISLTSVSRRGDHLAVSTDSYSKEGNGRGKNTAEKVGGGAAVGAILGGIFGGGKGAGIGAAAGGGLGAGANGITRGQQVQIASETVVRFRLSSPVTVRVRSDAADDSSSSRRPLE